MNQIFLYNKIISKTYILAVVGLVSIFCNLNHTHAAAGDIRQIRIAGNTVHNGWTAEIDIEGVATGGVYNTGLSTNNDPANSGIVFTVTSPGFDVNGNTTTIVRNVYGTKFVRKPFPNQTVADEISNGDTTTIKVALSDFVYSGDTNITATIKSGLYVRNATSSAVVNFPVINNSTLDYPKVIARWVWPGFEKVSGDFLVEALAFHRSGQHGKPVAAVKFTARDEDGNTVTQIVNDLTKSTRQGDANVVQVYAATIPTAGLTQGQKIEVNFEAYPWVGTASSVTNSAIGADGFAQPDERLGPLTNVLDKTGSYGTAYALVDLSGKVSTTTGAQVYNSQSEAESAGAAKAFTTIGRAAEAIKAYQKANFGRNSAGGGVILINQGNHTFPGYTPPDLGPMDTWLTVKPATNVANAVIARGSNAVFRAEKLKVEGLTISSTSTTGILRGSTSTSALWLHNNTLNLTAQGPIYSFRTAYATQNRIVALAQGLRQFSVQRSPYALIRGNNSDRLVSGTLYAIVGNNNINLTSSGFIESNNNAGQRLSENSIYAFNSVFRQTASNSMAYSAVPVRGIAVVQNVLESLSSVTPNMQIAADSTTAPVNNVIIWNNTMSGARTNLAYNEYGTTNVARFNWSKRFNSYYDVNTKDDTFGAGPANGIRQGSWPMTYNIGTMGDISQVTTFPGSFEGISSRIKAGVASPLYIQDGSRIGTNLGNGNYNLAPNSIALDFATSTDWLNLTLPFDFAGNPIYGPKDSGAYEFIPPFTMGTDSVNTSNGIRLYGDGKFRNRGLSASGSADLLVSIPSGKTSDWLDIQILSWDGATTTRSWRESTTSKGVSNTYHSIGGLVPGSIYTLNVNGAIAQNIPECPDGACVAGSNGKVTFTYTGGYTSPVVFTLTENPTV